MLERRASLLLLLVGALSCSSPTEPHQNVTLFVTNTTCSAGQCTPIRVFAFPRNQPLTPGGLWSVEVGVLTTASACMRLPASSDFYVIQLPHDTTGRYHWTPEVAASLGAQPVSDSRLFAHPSTGDFVMSDEQGWSIDLPGASHATATAGCTP